MFEGIGCSTGAADERYNCEGGESHGFQEIVRLLKRGEFKDALVVLGMGKAILYTYGLR